MWIRIVPFYVRFFILFRGSCNIRWLILLIAQLQRVQVKPGDFAFCKFSRSYYIRRLILLVAKVQRVLVQPGDSTLCKFSSFGKFLLGEFFIWLVPLWIVLLC